LSQESQIAAAFAAGKSFYSSKDYQSTAKWLTQYISLAKDRDDKDLHSAYFILGKTRLAMGKSDIACEAFRCALSGQLSREEHIETLKALVEGYMEQQRFVEALGVLEDAYSLRFSQAESVQILLLRSRVLRAMGLIDKAIAILGDRSQYVDDIQLKIEIDFEFSQCCIEKGDVNLAYKKLSEILILTKSGPLAYKIAYKLSEVCFQLGQYAQTISVCLQLLDLQPPEQIKQDTLKLLARAYSKQKNYNRAALAFFGQWK
jgi:tetratricopeptide (TPR) repeat protein